MSKVFGLEQHRSSHRRGHEEVEERHELRPFLVEALSVFPCKTACRFLLLSGEKRQRRDRPQTGVLAPGTSALTKLSPERATEHITCLISNCLYLCRPFGTFHVVAQLPGVLPFGQAQAENTPVCGLSSLRDFRVSPHEMLLSRKPNYRCISRGALDFPLTTIKN